MRTMGRKGRVRGRELRKALSPGAARGFASANMSAQPRAVALGDAINALTGGPGRTNGLVIDDETRWMMRDPRDEVPFGPINPLRPDALDPVRPDTKRPEPRLTEYPVAWNLPGSADAPVPWATLRAAAENVDIMRRCISVRKEQLQGLDWSITLDDQVVTDQHAMAAGATGREDIEAELRRKLLPEIDRLTQFWRNPWKANGLSFEQWVNGVMEDHLVLDAVAVYPRLTYGGELSAFELIDPTTIKLLIDYRGARPQAPFPAFQQILYGFPRAEFGSCYVAGDDEDTVQPVEGMLADQLFYFREEYRSFTPYGYSAVQQALISARLYLRRQGWMLAEYDDGSTPLTFLVPDATDGTLVEKLTPRTRQQWEDSINSQLAGQTRARNRMKVLQPGMTPVQMTGVDERYKPDYDMHLIKMLAGHFGVTSSGLGFSESKGLGNSGLHEGQASVQDAATTKPDKRMIERIVNELMRCYQGAPAELKFKFTETDVEDAAAKDAAAAAQRERGVITMNDDRKALGKSPFTFREADMPMVKVGDGWVPFEGMADRAEQAAEAEQALVEDQLATSEQSRELADAEASMPAEDIAKVAEARALISWRRKRGGRAGRPFVCKALEPDDFVQGVPADVDFAEWEWQVDDESIEKAFGGNDNWRTLARDHRGRWVKRGSMRVDALGPATPDKPVLASLRADAERRRTAAAPKSAASRAPAELATPYRLSAAERAQQEGIAESGLAEPRQVRGVWHWGGSAFEDQAAADAARRAAIKDRADQHEQAMNTHRLRALEEWEAENPESQLPVSDASSTMGGMTTPKARKPALSDAAAATLSTIAERGHGYEHLARQGGIHVNSLPGLLKRGLLERYQDDSDGKGEYFRDRVRLTDAGRTALAEHNSPAGRATRLEYEAAQHDKEAAGWASNGAEFEGAAQRHRDAGERKRAEAAALRSEVAPAAAPELGSVKLTSEQAMTPAGQRYGAAKIEHANAAERLAHIQSLGRGTTDLPAARERMARAEVELRAAQGALTAPTPERHDASVRDVVTALQDAPGGWVAMADVRRKLEREHGMDRGQQDAAIRRLATTGDRALNTAPEDNQKTLTEADHAAAVDFGAGPQHVISLDPPRAADDRVNIGDPASVQRWMDETGDYLAAAQAAREANPHVDAKGRRWIEGADGLWRDGNGAAVPRSLLPAKDAPAERSVLDTVRESNEQAQAASAVIDSVPGLREGVARQQKPMTQARTATAGGDKVSVSLRRGTSNSVDVRVNGVKEYTAFAEDGAAMDAILAREVASRAPRADGGPVTVREEGRHNNPGHALPTTPPAARAEAVAASTPDAPSTAPAVPTARRMVIPASVTGKQRATMEKLADRTDERNAAMIAESIEASQRQLADARAFAAENPDNPRVAEMVATAEHYVAAPRGDAALASVKGARELVARAEAEGYVVRVSHHAANNGAPFFKVEGMNPETGNGFEATWHTFKGKNGSYAFNGAELKGKRHLRNNSASVKKINEAMDRDKPVMVDTEALAAELNARRNVDVSQRVETGQVEQGDWRWHPTEGWQKIGMIEPAKPYAHRVIWGADRETRLGTLSHGSSHIIARQAERPTLPPRSEGLKGLQRKPGEAAKRGDVYVVERETDIRTASRERVKHYEVYEVTSVTREGKPRAVRRLTDEPGGYEQKMDQFGSLGRTLGYGTSSVIPGDRIDVDGLRADLRARTYNNSTMPKHHDDLRELGDVLYGRMKPAA